MQRQFAALKPFSFILALYIILLAAVPCCAFDNCPDDNTEQQSAHESGDGDCGNCSPFFSCEGCATATLAWQSFHVEVLSFKATTVYTFYQQASLPEIEYDFWQPPKLG